VKPKPDVRSSLLDRRSLDRACGVHGFNEGQPSLVTLVGDLLIFRLVPPEDGSVRELVAQILGQGIRQLHWWPDTVHNPVVSSGLRGFAPIMFGIIADDDYMKDDQTTEFVGKRANLIRFGAKLSKEAFE
jgi:hypothetical protein